MLTPGTPEENKNTGKEFEINLLDVAIVLAKHLKLLIALPLITAIIAGFSAHQRPDLYTADTTFMPPKQSASVSSMVSSLVGGGGGISGPNEMYLAVLTSRSMQDRMIKRFNLFSVYKTKSLESARGALAGQTAVKTTKDGLIHLQITDTNPKLAALLANGYVEVLLQMNNELALTEAAQHRLAAEQEFLKAKNNLSDAENTVKSLQENTGMITVGPQIAALQTMINSTERQLAEMSLYATPGNPDYIKAKQKLANLQTEIGKAQEGSKYVSKAPERILEYTHKARDLKYAESLYQLALQQLTLARVDEAKAGSSIQVLDRAVVPEQKSGPLRSRSVLIASMIAFIIAVMVAFIVEAFQRLQTNTESEKQLQTLRTYLRLK